MTTYFELLATRRSIRQFAPEPVPSELREQLCEALLRAPSSRGRNPWEFVLMDDPEQLEQLARVKAHGAAFLAGASLAVVIAADPEISDVWIEDCAIAATYLQLAAESLGLKSCWAQVRMRQDEQGRDAEKVLARLAALPERFRAVCVIGVGYPAETKPGHEKGALPWQKVHRRHYQAGN